MKIQDLPNGTTNITLDKDCDSTLCFRAVNKENCIPVDLTTYNTTLKIYIKWSDCITLGKPRVYWPDGIDYLAETDRSTPSLGRVCMRMTKNETRDDYCGMEKWCCYCYEVYAEKSTWDKWDRICLAQWTICINDPKCLLNTIK